MEAGCLDFSAQLDFHTAAEVRNLRHLLRLQIRLIDKPFDHAADLSLQAVSARNEAVVGQGQALPGFRPGGQVFLVPGRRRDQFSLPAHGPQPGVNPVNDPLALRDREDFVEALNQTDAASPALPTHGSILVGIEVDQVQVGVVAEVVPPQFSQGQYGHVLASPPGEARTKASFQVFTGQLEGGQQAALGQAGHLLPDLVPAQLTQHVLHPDSEHLGLLIPPQTPAFFPAIPGLPEQGAQLGRETGAGLSPFQLFGVNQGVKEFGPPAEEFRKESTGGEQSQESGQNRRGLVQQRVQGIPIAQGGGETLKCRQAGVGVGTGLQASQQSGHQVSQQVAHPGRCVREGRGIPQQGNLVVSGSQVCKSAGGKHVVSLLLRKSRVEHQCRFPDLGAGSVLPAPVHQFFKHAMDLRRVSGIGLPQPVHGVGDIGPTYPHPPGALVEVLFLLRQFVGLEMKDHLKLVFQVPQKLVGFLQTAVFPGVEESSLVQGLQGAHRLRLLQVRMAASVNELKCLDEKFDLANAALSQLDVPFLFPLGTQLGVDAVLDLLKLLQRGKIQVLAVGEGSKGLAEGLPQLLGPAHRPGLDQGQSFEGFPPTAVVVPVVGQGSRNPSGSAFGAQP